MSIFKSKQPVLPYLNEAWFSCAELNFLEKYIETLPGLLQLSTVYKGVMLKNESVRLPNKKALQEKFTLYGIYFTTAFPEVLGQPALTTGLRNGIRSTRENRLKVLPHTYDQLPDIDFVFFYPDVVAYLANSKFSPNQTEVQISRAIVDYGNGHRYQTFKMRPDPDPIPLTYKRDQQADVAYLVGSHCPPTWREPATVPDPSFVFSVTHNGETLVATTRMLFQLLEKDYVLFDPPKPWPDPVG